MRHRQRRHIVPHRPIHRHPRQRHGRPRNRRWRWVHEGPRSPAHQIAISLSRFRERATPKGAALLISGYLQGPRARRRHPQRPERKRTTPAARPSPGPDAPSGLCSRAPIQGTVKGAPSSIRGRHIHAPVIGDIVHAPLLHRRSPAAPPPAPGAFARPEPGRARAHPAGTARALIAATLDLGRVFYSQITIANAAREGAMQAADTPTSFLANQACNKTTNKVMCRVVTRPRARSSSVAPADVSARLHAGLHHRDRQHRHGQRERPLRPDHPAAGWVPGRPEPDAHLDRRRADRDGAGHQLAATSTADTDADTGPDRPPRPRRPRAPATAAPTATATPVPTVTPCFVPVAALHGRARPAASATRRTGRARSSSSRTRTTNMTAACNTDLVLDVR